MPWDLVWPKADERGLARYVTEEANQLLTLEINRTDLLAGPDPKAGRRAVVEAIYSALAKAHIQYAKEPYNDSKETQAIRTPHEILVAPREGTCIDLVFLFCGLCLNNDLVPVMVLVKGHAFAMVSLAADRRDATNRNLRPELASIFRRGITTDGHALRSLIDSEKPYLAVECTGFAFSERMNHAMPEGSGRSNGLLSFDRAVGAGLEQFETDGRDLVFALDICSLHTLYGFKPLASTKQTDSTPPVTINNHASNYGAQGVFNAPVTIDNSQKNTTVHGNQTNISGDVSGPILSGTFSGPVVLGGNTGTVQQVNVSGGNVGSIIGSQHNQGSLTYPSEASTDQVRNLQERLAIQRTTLTHYLKQVATMGSAYAPPHVTHGIREARQEITKIKHALRNAGIQVDNHPDDE
jgi:hypothetical protein